MDSNPELKATVFLLASETVEDKRAVAYKQFQLKSKVPPLIFYLKINGKESTGNKECNWSVNLCVVCQLVGDCRNLQRSRKLFYKKLMGPK